MNVEKAAHEPNLRVPLFFNKSKSSSLCGKAAKTALTVTAALTYAVTVAKLANRALANSPSFTDLCPYQEDPVILQIFHGATNLLTNSLSYGMYYGAPLVAAGFSYINIKQVWNDQ